MTSSSDTQSWKYDVFLSFRGTDTRKNYVDHLYSALEEKGISTYKDDDSFTEGGSIVSTLWKAIEESQIAVIIFSKNYADSSWCLEELTYIMKCSSERGQIVFPVFYDVDPSDVRRQSGKYREALEKHELKNKNKVESWRKALTDAGNLAGLDVKNIAHGHEAESIKVIADEILRTLSNLINKETIVQDLDSSPSQSVPASVSGSWSYDVFLSFRGEDTRKNYVDHLYSALVKKGISVYKGDVILTAGVPIKSSVFKAIEGSRIAVVIFSENYAESSWCLEELTHIMSCRSERGHIVMPVFYDVDPSDVRRQRRKYEEAFKKHELKDENKVESWRKALTDAGNLAGWDVKNIANGHEAKSIKVITDHISRTLSDMIRDETILQHLDSSPSLSAPASVSHSWSYDVFLSFRGEDTRKNYVDHLYSALVKKGISIYRDDETLTRGVFIESAICKAVEGSRIAVVIFSKKYADSSWCLDELTHIMRCNSERGQIVIPIFYDVDRLEVQRQSGEYKEAFKKHELKNKNNVESWRKALRDAGNLAGWDVKNIADGYEAESIKVIADRISQTLSDLIREETIVDKISQQIWPPVRSSPKKDLIGIEPSIQDLKSSSSQSISASVSRSWKYDVFLSFRGEDTRKIYADHLYNALVQKGILTYKDNEVLPPGEPIVPAILEAIEESRIAVIIFSKNYADSSWCLEEATYIMKCNGEIGKTVIPIFYDVDPSEVSEQKGKFAEAFAKHELKNKKKAASWRKALTDVANFAGWEVKNIANGHEAKSIEVIADHILHTLSDLIHEETFVQELESSSSKSVPTSFSHSCRCDVFVSHGEYTRNTFVDHLYTSLAEQNIYAFRDDLTLEQGTSIRSSPFKAIEESKIAVIVFSKNYADSSLCLDELVYIMKCKEERGQAVLPIFYDIKPSEVRHQKRKYGEAFEKHNLENSNKVESWRKALSEAANITGWSLNQIGHEVVCIAEIVGTISQLLHPVLSFSPGTSSSPSSQCRNHDIFLSFIGEYDSNTFVDRLYSTLIQQGIHTYKSDGILSHGDSNGSFPLNAIEESQIAIIIFTKNYARSSRCLDELSYIMKCIDIRGMHVMPIFYDVTSSDVQEQSGEFGKEFDKQEWENMAKVESWRKALKGACNHSGWSLKEIANRHEGRYIKDIVNTISCILLSLMSKAKKELVGIEPRLQGLTSKLAIRSDDVRMVVVRGIGGSGKTTIASCVYMEISRRFEGRCFVENIREESSKYGLKRLQQKILSAILKKEVAVPNDEEGRRMIQTMLCNKNVLIVLDDVIDIDQMLSLVGSHDSFGKGSIIIITSRDERFPLNVNDVSYSVSLLSYDEAVQLFERHAYLGHRSVEKGKQRRSSSSVEAYRTFSHEVISYANGLPLALVILGCFLYGKEENVWKSALVKLKDTRELGKLKISYDGLQDVEKELFLDIACFFKGSLIDSSMMLLLEAFYVDPIKGVNELVQKSLITISNGMFGIHDLVEEMAHYIVRGEPPRHLEEHSRIWLSSDVADICATNTVKQDNNKIQALYAPNNDAPPNLLEVVGNMKALQLLNVRQHVTAAVEEPLFFSDALRWISWENYPAKSFPSSFQPTMLLSLSLRNGLQEVLWQGTKDLPRLKVLDLHGSKNLIATPDFSGLTNLESLVLSGCSGLKEIHESIGNHENLVYLNLEGCEKLETFPPIVTMPKLETLILSRCSRLLKFPEIKETMNGLQHLHLDYSGIEVVPSTVGKYCINLVFINLIGCKHLKSIEGNFQGLKRKCLILVD